MSEFEDIEIWGEKDKTSSSSVKKEKKEKAVAAEASSSSSSSSKSLLYGLLGFLFLGALAVGAFLLLSGGDSTDSADGGNSVGEKNGSETSGGEGGTNESSLEAAKNGGKTEDGTPLLIVADSLPFPDSTELQDKVKGDGSAWIVADQKNLRFKVSGEVPDAASKEAIEKSMKQTWGDLAKSEITVNDSLAGGPWLQDMPGVMRNLATMGIDTSISANNSKMYFDGNVPSDIYMKSFTGSLKKYENLPEIENNLAPAGLVDQEIDIQVEDGKATLAGFVPSQGMIDTLEYYLQQQYGPANVVNTMTVREDSVPSFLILGFDNNIKTFSAFSSHRLKVAFNEKAQQRQFSGAITSGIAFEQGSTNLSPTLVASLEGFINLSNRTGRPIQIIGHTDTDGDAAFNLELSKQRAEEAKKAFIERGFPAERINTFGKGEEQPLVEENTPADKELNRRVEIIMGELEE